MVDATIAYSLTLLGVLSLHEGKQSQAMCSDNDEFQEDYGAPFGEVGC